MEKKDLKISKKTVVFCPTKKLAKKVLDLANSLGYPWIRKPYEKDYLNWESCKDRTCYDLYAMTYGEYYLYDSDISYTIISAEDFLKRHQAPTINILPTKNSISEVDPNHVTESVLSEASRILNGDRQADYGDAVDNFKHIAGVVNLALRREDITPDLCCVVHIATKLCREGNKHKRDNLTDLAAYSEIMNQIKEKE